MKEITKKTLVVFWRHAVKYKLALGTIIVLVTASVAIDLIRPFLIKDLFDTLAIPGEKQADRVL